MFSADFISPLSYYSVSVNYGDDALFLQPEERTMQLYTGLTSQAFETSPFPYFADVPIGGATAVTDVSVPGDTDINGGAAAFTDTGFATAGLTIMPATDSLIPTPPADTFQSNVASDVLTGSAVSDTFIFEQGRGATTITDFNAEGPDHDLVDLSRTSIDTFAAVRDLAHQHGDDVVMHFGHGDSLVLQDTSIHDLHRMDFMF